jgi:hypothetical protein
MADIGQISIIMVNKNGELYEMTTDKKANKMHTILTHPNGSKTHQSKPYMEFNKKEILSNFD